MNKRALACLLLLGAAACRKQAPPPDPLLGALGTLEVKARLLELPEGSIVRRELYTYAAVMKYEVLAVHRGDLRPGDILYVAHYNPHLARAEAADRFVPDVGGSLTAFHPGQIHHLALAERADSAYLGALVDPYWQDRDKATRWALWTAPGP
jgi:hypothetical protein